MVSEVVSIFVLVLIISVLAGLTFLFVSELKTQAANTAAITWTISGESTNDAKITSANITPYQIWAARNDALSSDWTITDIYNATKSYDVGNVTLNASGYLTNATTVVFQDTGVRINYTYTSAAGTPAYSAINDTEDAGATLVDYLPLIFLALIFGVVLTLVLKIIIPYINLGKNFGQF